MSAATADWFAPLSNSFRVQFTFLLLSGRIRERECFISERVSIRESWKQDLLYVSCIRNWYCDCSNLFTDLSRMGTGSEYFNMDNLRCLMAEFLGTAILVFTGLASCLNWTHAVDHDQLIRIGLTFGLTLAGIIYVSLNLHFTRPM